MPEGKDEKGFAWIQETRYEDYYYLKDFEHLVITKVNEFSQTLPPEHWEAIIFEDERCQKVIARQPFATMEEAKQCLENIVENTLKNHKNI